MVYEQHADPVLPESAYQAQRLHTPPVGGSLALKQNGMLTLSSQDLRPEGQIQSTALVASAQWKVMRLKEKLFLTHY